MNELEQRAARAEARLLLRWAAADLTRTQRAAVESFAAGRPVSLDDLARELGVSRGGMWMAEQAGFKKMRRRLEMLGIHSTEELL